MRKTVLAMLGSAAIMCAAAGSANASNIITGPPNPNLGDDTLGGTEQFGDFVNFGDTLRVDIHGAKLSYRLPRHIAAQSNW